jgi:Uma2 family endonuclease
MADLTAIEQKTVTQDMLLAREANAEDDVYFEVVDGEIIEEKRGMTWEHVTIIRLLFKLLDSFATKNSLGEVYPDGARYVLRGSNDAIIGGRMPDLSFVRAGRIAPDFNLRGDFEGAPDLAVEVLSPGQSPSKLIAKLGEFMDAGSEEGWLIVPRRQQLLRLRSDIDGYDSFTINDTFTTPLFPNLQISLTDIFPPTP